MTNIAKLRMGTEESVARFLTKIFLEGMLNGIALAVCDGDDPESISKEDVDEAFSEQGEVIMQKYLDMLRSESAK